MSRRSANIRDLLAGRSRCHFEKENENHGRDLWNSSGFWCRRLRCGSKPTEVGAPPNPCVCNAQWLYLRFQAALHTSERCTSCLPLTESGEGPKLRPGAPVSY